MIIASARWPDRAAWLRAADYLATLVAVTLPWSTSATSIAIVLWLVALVPTLRWERLRSVVTTLPGGLPVALALLGAVGMIWADVSLTERLSGFSSFLRLLVIPLLFVQFSESGRWQWPLIGFLWSCVALLATSILWATFPETFARPNKTFGVPVKDYIAQTAEFTLAAAGAYYIALIRARAGRGSSGLIWALLGCAFIADIAYVATSRTALVTIPVLAGFFLLSQFSGRTRVVTIAIGLAIIPAIWFSAPVMRERLGSLPSEIEQFRTSGKRTSAGERIDYWSKGVEIVREAPVIGHGTGSIRQMYQRAAVDKTGSMADATANPHNQSFAVAIQLGIAGAALLWAMWLAHLFMFLPGHSLSAFVGAMVVLQNVVGSLFNSHLFDFTHGWIYVFGVGVAGGAAWARSSEGVSSSDAGVS